MIKVLFPSHSCQFVDVERPLWLKDRSVVYSCSWASPAQSFVSESIGTHDHTLLSQIWDFNNREGQAPVFISPLEQGNPTLKYQTVFFLVFLFLFLGSASCCAYFIKVIREIVPRDNSSWCLFIFYIFVPLHVSALVGHLQAAYTTISGSYFTYNGSALLVAFTFRT
jgi:hypothetical protein